MAVCPLSLASAAAGFGGGGDIRLAKEFLAGQMGPRAARKRTYGSSRPICWNPSTSLRIARGSVHHVAFRAANDAAQAGALSNFQILSQRRVRRTASLLRSRSAIRTAQTLRR